MTATRQTIAFAALAVTITLASCAAPGTGPASPQVRNQIRYAMQIGRASCWERV